MAVSVIDQEIVSLLFEILSAVQRQEQIQLLQDVKTLVNGMVGLVGQNFAQSLSNGYKLDQLAGKASALQAQVQTVSTEQQQLARSVATLPGAVASGVWAETDPVTGNTFGADVGLAATLAYLHNTFGIIRAEFEPRFAFTMFEGSIALNPGPARTPNWDSTKILSTDDLVSYLNRVAGVGTWLYGTAPGDTDYAVNYGTSSDPFNWLCLVSRQEFAQLQQQLGLLPSGTAPVWPGLSHVTLGTQVAITPPTQSIPGPMDGVLVDITGGTANLPHYKVGTMDSWKALGTLMFLTDDGAAETFQLLAAATAVYVPRAMTHAASAQFKWLPGLTGTVTPWTIS